ncbi:MAG: ribokinaselike protein, partial [Pseudonocardiales bacterium]|nr:ribokinaselike protein [Pseudonocardiales bacterium]
LDDVDSSLFVVGRYLHVSGYALFGDARPAARHALALARAAGLTISVGAASAAPLLAVGAAAFLDWIGPDVLLFANQDEATILTGLEDPGKSARALAERVGRVVVTSGSAGALWCDGGEVIRESTSAVTPLDTTGAGDAFAAAFLVALGQGAEPGPALRAANRLGAEACLRRGGRPPLLAQPLP